MKKKIHPYWTKYKSSENGSVYGVRGSELSPILHHTGYLVITVRQYNVQKQVRVHRFVWECHRGEIPDGLVINHKDGDKTNNSIDNLEVVTHRVNIIHAWEQLGRVSVKGEDKPQAKITEDQAKDIIELCRQGVSNKIIGAKFNLSPNYISLIRHKRRWKHLPRHND